MNYFLAEKLSHTKFPIESFVYSDEEFLKHKEYASDFIIDPEGLEKNNVVYVGTNLLANLFRFCKNNLGALIHIEKGWMAKGAYINDKKIVIHIEFQGETPEETLTKMTLRLDEIIELAKKNE